MIQNAKYRKLFSVIFLTALISISVYEGFHQRTLFADYFSSLFSDVPMSADELQDLYIENLKKKNTLIDLNGVLAGIMKMKSFYSGSGIYICDNKYIITPYEQTTTDYEYDQISSFYQFCREHDIRFLYVNQPTKYLDDSVFADNFGIESFSNRNADQLLSRIMKSGIPCVDLRENLTSQGLDIHDMFYRTDHHWTVPAGLWASGQIADALNRYCGYTIDLSLYDDSDFEFHENKKCWLGEQGQKIGRFYMGYDDFVRIKPIFPTDYSFKSKEGDLTAGSFDYFMDENEYRLHNSMHYIYQQRDAVNHAGPGGKLLMLDDSFGQVTEPFISLGVSEIDHLILREQDDSFDLKKYILENSYDTVIVCYTQTMIGAHDDPESANRKMFRFD